MPGSTKLVASALGPEGGKITTLRKFGSILFGTFDAFILFVS